MFSNPEKNISQFHVDQGMIVSDFGSGSGHYSIALAKAVGSSGKVYSIDIQQSLLQKLKNTANEMGISNINVIWADLEKPRGSTLKDGILDRVIVANTFFQIEKKDEFVEEIKRVLKPKGKVLFIDWTHSFNGLGPVGNMIVTHDMARVIFESHGFIFEKDILAGDHHYGLIFKNYE